MDASNSKAISARLDALNVVLTNFTNSVSASSPVTQTITTTGAQPWAGSVPSSLPLTAGGYHLVQGGCFPHNGEFWGDNINKDGPQFNKDNELFDILRKQGDVAALDAKIVELRALVAAEEEKL